MTETTSRPVSLHLLIAYRDAPAALTWLQRAFGFETTMRYDDERGGIAHSELLLGDAVIVVFSDHDGYDRLAPRGTDGDATGYGAYLTLPDRAAVDATYHSAVAAGATVVWKLHDSEWGNYRFRVLDPEGREWSFGVHLPGEPQTDEWS